MNLPSLKSQQTPFRITRNVRFVTALACAGVMLPALAFAADPAPEAPAPAAATSQTGTVEGRVFNADSGKYLPNARVTVEGTRIQTFTNDRGEYQLRNVPVGAATLKVSFTGQNELTETVTVDGTSPAAVNFTFNAEQSNQEANTIVLDKFVVESRRFRNAVELATNEERTATNIKSVVALDSLGYMVDGNIGDFVRYQAGVDVDFGSSSGNTNNPDSAMTVGVRGFGADSTAILVDGMPIASGSVSGSGSLTRAVMLDGLSINNASRLEIIKVATPDMPQDSPGGVINLITRGAFELAKIRYDISLAFNGNTNTPSPLKKTSGPYGPSFKTLPSLRFSASIPFSKKLGVTFSVASDNKYSLTRNSNLRDWFYTNRNVTINGVTSQVANAKGGIRIDNPVLERMELVDNQWVDHRYSGSLRVDWRPIPNLEIRVNGQLSTFENTGVYRRTQWRYQNAAGILDWGSDYLTGRQRTSTFNPGYSVGMTTDSRDKRGFTSSGYITAVYNKGPWSINAKASASESYSDLPDLKNGHFSTIDSSLTAGRIDLVGINSGLVEEIKVWDVNGNPVDYGPYTAWNPSLTPRSSQVQARDLQKQYNLDVSRELEFLPFPTTVKIGGMQRSKSARKSGRGTGYRMQYIGPTADQPTAAMLASEFTTEPLYGYGTPQQWTDTAKYYEFYKAHPEWFTDQYISTGSDNTNLIANNYLSAVNNTKGLTTTDTQVYGMVTSKLFHNRLTIIAGGRQSMKKNKGYNVFNDPKFMYLRNADGTLYRDSVYTAGIRFDGNQNTVYPTGDPRRLPNAVLTDAALRSRLQAAGVPFIPNQLELAPNGIANGTDANNLFMAMRRRYTKLIDTKLTEPITPQVQMAYEITDTLRAQVSWSRETRLPELEAANGILVGGSSFQISESDNPTSDPGGDGSITISNVQGKPEINKSYNFRLGYYPKNGLGRYSISYYYKVVDNAWQTIDTYSTDGDYESLLEAMGLTSDEFRNYRISTTTPTGLKQIRKGFEIEASQNMGILAPWAKGVDLFVTYTRRPVTANTGGEARLGWIPMVPVRAKWTGGASYSMRRFSVQAKFTWVESGITYNSNPTVTLPDGTNAVVQFYDLNNTNPDINLQANYVFNKHFTFFATANRLGSPRIFRQISDAQTGYQPDYASYRSMQDKGVALALGVNASF